jgi:cobyrinic acid a,c-diamide synthase
MPIPRLLMIAGQSSGVGKTTCVLGLISALRRRGLTVQPFKCGPDYIDPTYHSLAAGRPCRNLDTWMLAPEQMVASFHRACAGADIALVEGVMGLYDGAGYGEETGSAAHIAKLLGAPVVLVLDIGKLARSAGALALGYRQFDPDLSLAGFLLNHAGSEGHAAGCAQAVQQATGLPVLGWMPKQSHLHIPERHLGLIPTDERGKLDGLIQAAGDAVMETYDLDAILHVAQPVAGSRQATQDPETPATSPASPGATWPLSPLLAVARDEAFSFYNPDNLEVLAAAGARIHFFSPLRGDTLPPETAGVYLGGGFPEVYAEQLSRNQALWTQLRRLHAADVPIYAECGGFMALTAALVDGEGRRWPMAGLVPGETHMQARLAALGYRLAQAHTDNLLLSAGATARGHEFHYSHWRVEPSLVGDRSAWLLRRGPDDEPRLEGYAHGSLLASYLHIHFGQDPSLGERFVAQMRKGGGEPQTKDPQPTLKCR